MLAGAENASLKAKSVIWEVESSFQTCATPRVGVVGITCEVQTNILGS